MNQGEEFGEVIPRLWVYGIVVAALLGVMSLITMQFRPALLSMEREALQSSHQYLDGKRAMMLQYVEEVRSIDVDIVRLRHDVELVEALTTQRASVVNRLRVEAQTIPSTEVPASVAAILER